MKIIYPTYGLDFTFYCGNTITQEKMVTTKPIVKKRFQMLLDALSSINDPQELRDFLYDLCTPAEIESLSDRWQVAKLIDAGESYRDIAEKTKVSTTTITRVGRSLKYGTGGYKKAIARSST
jgi:TrpR-related protein YerC/YecD